MSGTWSNAALCLLVVVGVGCGWASKWGSSQAEVDVPRMISTKCNATGAFTKDECACMEREAKAGHPALVGGTVDPDWMTQVAHKCAPSANSDPLGPPIVEKPRGVVAATITTSPVGAEVFLNRTSTGQKTPCTLELTADTPQTVEVRLEGFLAQKREVQYRVGDPASLAFALQAEATVSVTTVPPGARVFVGDRSVIDQTPGVAKGLTPGQARVVIHLEGWVDVVKDLDLAPGLSLTETLLPASYLAITSQPTGAEVEVDGVKMMQRTPTPVPVIPKARHRVVVSAGQLTPVTRVVKSGPAGTTSTLSVTLVDGQLQALVASQRKAEAALARAEAALEKARARFEDVNLRARANESLTAQVQRAEDDLARAEEAANDAAAALQEYQERRGPSTPRP